ncbi:MAG TPA: outer membrane beta-barrel protein [Verrucomicrobiae bacterium]
MERLEKENEALRKRLESIESVMQKEGLSASMPTNAVKALSDIQISGFVTASYFYDTSDPEDRKSNGYLWNTSENSFSLNKVKVTIASAPVERSGDSWDAAYRASLIFGEDAPIVNTGGELQGLEDLREAYVELNAPLGSGLNIKAGQLISLLNYESGDGGAANPNFSQGYQWFYTGNGPSAGVQLGYTFTDWLDAKVRVQNGLYAGAVDNNSSKTYMGSLGFKPLPDLWFSVIGFGGHESAGFDLLGGSLLAGYQFTEAFGIGFEFDYFQFDPSPAPEAELWSVGAWLTYNFTEKVGLALRGEYLDDSDGFGIPNISLGGRPGSAIVSPDTEGVLSSLTLTLNYKPVPNVKVQPEIRYDHTSYEDGFDGQESRFLVGAGISYLF